MSDASRSTKVARWAVNLGIFVIALHLVSVLYGIMDPPDEYSITFVVPNGFSGVFTIIHDPSVESEGVREVSGGYEFTVPNNAVLKVKDASIFQDWHKEIARYADGKSIPLGSGGPIGLFGLGATADGEFYWLIGSYEEYQTYWKDHKTWYRIETGGEAKR